MALFDFNRVFGLQKGALGLPFGNLLDTALWIFIQRNLELFNNILAAHL